MLVISMSDDSVIVGLTKKTVDAMRFGNPATMDMPVPRPVRRIIVVYGDDKIEIIRRLEAAHVDVPQHFKDSVTDDPL
jgi:hypothetical protein